MRRGQETINYFKQHVCSNAGTAGWAHHKELMRMMQFSTQTVRNLSFVIIISVNMFSYCLGICRSAMVIIHVGTIPEDWICETKIIRETLRKGSVRNRIFYFFCFSLFTCIFSSPRVWGRVLCSSLFCFYLPWLGKFQMTVVRKTSIYPNKT